MAPPTAPNADPDTQADPPPAEAVTVKGPGRASPSRAARILMGPVRAYRYFLSPWLGSACRFEPTCSVYMLEALSQHGAVSGLGWGARRLLRCHPWCEGGWDPVPDRRLGDRARGPFNSLLSKRPPLP